SSLSAFVTCCYNLVHPRSDLRKENNSKLGESLPSLDHTLSSPSECWCLTLVLSILGFQRPLTHPQFTVPQGQGHYAPPPSHGYPPHSHHPSSHVGGGAPISNELPSLLPQQSRPPHSWQFRSPLHLTQQEQEEDRKFHLELAAAGWHKGSNGFLVYNPKPKSEEDAKGERSDAKGASVAPPSVKPALKRARDTDDFLARLGGGGGGSGVNSLAHSGHHGNHRLQLCQLRVPKIPKD
ncbi:hypothetical protein T439DRAFT_346508, partial [Meredithblackwellia eburnea MCA 4105]